MAQTTLIQLTDDLTGGSADETISFALDGKAYAIDLNKKNAAAMRKTLATYVDHARVERGRRAARRMTAPTLYSQLDDQDKAKVRAWTGSRAIGRISDAKIKEWIDAGRP